MSETQSTISIRARAALVPCCSNEHHQCEQALLRGRTSYALQHRTAWQDMFGGRGNLFCAATGPGGEYEAGFGIEVSPSRSLPGHDLLRVQRYTPQSTAPVEEAMLRAVCAFARKDRHVLRVSMELFCRDEARRTATERLLAALGFTEEKKARRYERTLVLDLAPDEAALLKGFHRVARRNINKISSYPLEIRPIIDPVWAPRITQLLDESMGRTGGEARKQDWATTIEFSRRFPESARMCGLFRSDTSTAESLIAFAYGCNHGEYVTYDTCGATRSWDRGVPMAYPLLWELICWSKRNGARWFDFGGITTGAHGDGEDKLGGISDFKRFFSEDVVQLGGEWVLEPHPVRAKIARTLSDAARFVRGIHRTRRVPGS